MLQLPGGTQGPLLSCSTVLRSQETASALPAFNSFTYRETYKSLIAKITSFFCLIGLFFVFKLSSGLGSVAEPKA